MHPGLVVKLRPNGPWRIGPDSGARNRVDAIYHSDSLYSAVTSAMARLGSLEEWLDATARTQDPPAVRFSSCFPLLDGALYVVPPRTVWPPASPAISARVRWKSARFVPLEIVQAILAGRKLDENQWTIDGPSECLAPAGTPGPFRTAVRWSAAVDRLTGATERHSTACLEFRPGCGLWTVASFADEAARDRWQEPVKAAFRLLADTGFGGERSRGWGRSDAPEFVEGTLPEMILPAIRETAAAPGGAGASACQSDTLESSAPAIPDSAPAGLTDESVCPTMPPEESGAMEEPEVEPAEAEASVQAPPEVAPLLAESAEAPPEPESPAAVLTDESVCPTTPPEGGAGGSACQSDIPELPAPAIPDSDPAGLTDESVSPTLPPVEPAPQDGSVEEPAGEPAEAEASVQAPPEVAPLLAESAEAAPEPESPAAVLTDESVCPTAPPEGGAGDSACQADIPQLPTRAVPEQPPPAPAPGFEDARPHWLLSLFAPAPDDAVDWKRGNYAVLSRGGRVESPAGSGELKKQVHMVAEGSVLFAAPAPRGSATDVAPDGFAHPVYRAGFAVAIPLSKVS
jgi:CRISPR type III-A-associated RAMP protein Csm4